MNSFLKWTALIFVLSGAVCTTCRLDPYNIMCLNIGSALYFIWAIRVKDLNLTIVNGMLLVIYLMGAWIRSH